MIRLGLEVSISHFVSTGLGVYSRNLKGSLEEYVSNVEVLPLHIPHFMHKPKHPVIQKLYAAYWQLYHSQIVIPIQAKRMNYDLVHYTMTMPISSTLHCPCVTTVHDLIPILYPEWIPGIRGKRLRLGITDAIRRSNHIITDSENTKSDILKHFSIDEERVSVIPLGINKKDDSSEIVNFSTLKHVYGIKEDYVLCVGSLEPRKNLEIVLDAFHYMSTLGPNIPQLVIVGGDIGRRKALQKKIDKYELSRYVIFTGYIPHNFLAVLYSHAGVFLYPSMYEGFGLPPLEAMSYGCPVISSNVSSLPEVVGNAAILIDPTDSRTWAEAIMSLQQSQELSAKYRMLGLLQSQKYTWERCAKETTKVYKQILYNVASASRI